MQANASPFPPYWWGTSLGVPGLESVRPDLGTYGRYAFDLLPALPFVLRGTFDWLAQAEPYIHHIGAEISTEHTETVAELGQASAALKLRLPAAFLTFMSSPQLHERIRSNTDCFIDLSPAPIPSPLGGGYLVRFLSDSQHVLSWYLYLTKDSADHAVLASPDFYGTEDEQLLDEDEPGPDPEAIVFCAESFEAFLCRYWLENEIWFTTYEEKPMPEAGVRYIEEYRRKYEASQGDE
jgi:hypothetical protein